MRERFKLLSTMSQDASSQITYDYFQQSHNLLLDKIEQEWTLNRVGLIYFDIVQFSRIERLFGSDKCNRILLLLEGVFIKLKVEMNSILHFHRMGDDIFIYVRISNSQDENEEAFIQHYSKKCILLLPNTLLRKCRS